VFHVQGSYVEAEMDGCGAYDQVFEWDSDAFGCLLAFDSSGQLSNFKSDGIDLQFHSHIFYEDSATISMGGNPGPVNAVRKFNDADRR
jgi:hypothetical protein